MEGTNDQAPVTSGVKFGPFELFAEIGELRKDGVRLKLSGQPIQVLARLVADHGKLVTREELQAELWSGSTYGDFEKGLNAAVNRLRENLGDSATAPQYIETIPRRGYRFIGKVALAEETAGELSELRLNADETPKWRVRALLRRPLWLVTSTLVLIALLGMGWLLPRYHAVSLKWPARDRRINAAGRKAIAVLPFQNEGSDPDTNFLRSALPEEIATTLSYVPSFSISPSTMRYRYQYPSSYLQQAGNRLGVSTIITGRYVTDGDQLKVTLEAIDVASNRSVWSDTCHTSALDRIAMREQIESMVRQSLVPALGGDPFFVKAATRPRSEEAYDLYLRSIAVYHEPTFNKQAILMLEQSLSMDAGYAPAWQELGTRYFVDTRMNNGGETALQRSESAFARAVALDPNLILAATQLVYWRTERGDTVDAYAEASALVKRRSESSQAHLLLAYVLRYAGLLDKAAHECNTALALDPADKSLRACTWTFLQLGQPQKAVVFVELDQGSEWPAPVAPFLLLEQGRRQEARDAVQKMPAEPTYGRDLLQACLDSSQASSLTRISDRFEAMALEAPDPEDRYFFGRLFAYCGQKQAAFRVLKSAIGQNYCANTALLMDPFLANLRVDADFSGLLAASKECQDRFLQNKSVAELVEH